MIDDKLYVAVYDDNIDIIDAARIVFESKGFEVWSSITPSTYPNILKIDAVVIDQNLGTYSKSGHDLIREFRQLGFEGPMVIMSGEKLDIGNAENFLTTYKCKFFKKGFSSLEDIATYVSEKLDEKTKALPPPAKTRIRITREQYTKLREILIDIGRGGVIDDRRTEIQFTNEVFGVHL
jgi:DNA-binding NtrC family response regulator